MPVLRTRLRQSETLEQFLIELTDIADRVLRAQPPPAVAPPSYYSRVIDEIDGVGWDKLRHVSDDLSSFRLSITDAAKRSHEVTIELPPDYPREPPKCKAMLPAPLELSWHSGAHHSVKDAIQQYRKAIRSYQPLWNVLDDWDANTWILEPKQPTRADVLRRVVLGRACSLQVIHNPKRPHDVCECRFFGPETAIQPLQQLLNANLLNWDSRATPRANLSRILQIEFPSKTSADQEEFSLECGICYADSLQGVSYILAF